MTTNRIIKKLKAANIVGRGGAGFPTAIKWQEAKHSKGKPKYIICNASEGELGMFKDEYILENHLEEVFYGMQIAMDYLKTKEAYFNLNLEYYQKIKTNLNKLINKYKRKGYSFTVYKETPSYIGGESSALINAIEGKRLQPKLRPPYASEKGLFTQPTIINNVETLYNVALVEKNKFQNKRFYCISGKIKNPGVYHLDAELTIKEILEKSDNIPNYDFFVQIGGSVSGPVINKKQIAKQKMVGAGAIEIYKKSITTKQIFLKWFKFYNQESCGKCAPCREGTYQLYKITKDSKTIQWKKIMEIIDVLEKTSLCALGRGVAVPVKSYIKNILNK